MKSNFGNTLRSLSGPVLITGHTGFKGTWLTMLLQELEFEVIGYSLPPEKDSLYSLLKRDGAIFEKFDDVSNHSEVLKFIQKTKPVAIFHLAAQPLVLASYEQPAETFRTNVMGTVSILEAAFAVKSVKAVAAITTDKVYRNSNLVKKFIEGDPLEGKDPYSASKVGSEAAVSAWQQIQKLHGGPRVIAVRAGNVIGGGDYARDRLIPDLIRAYKNDSAVSIRNPESTRPWQHVLDPLIGYVMAIEKSILGNEKASYNFGPTERSLSVGDVVDIFKNGLGKNIEVVIEESKNQSESKSLDLDSSRARNDLNWSPKLDQAKAIEMTFDWWKAVIEQNLPPLEMIKKDLSTFLTEK